MLLAIERVRHGRSLPKLVGLKTPKRLAIRGVHSHERAAIFTNEYKTARSSKRAAPREARAHLRHLPRNLAGLNVDRPQNAVTCRGDVGIR